MSRVICPCCKTGFEARIQRDDYCINCVSCGVAFNAAAYLSKEDFEASAERRPPAGMVIPFDRGTQVLGNIIRPVEPLVPAAPFSPVTRTGSLPFMLEESEAEVPRAPSAVNSPEPKQNEQPGTGHDARLDLETRSKLSFFEASVSTSRFKAFKESAAPPELNAPAHESAFLKVSRAGPRPLGKRAVQAAAAVEQLQQRVQQARQVADGVAAETNRADRPPSAAGTLDADVAVPSVVEQNGKGNSGQKPPASPDEAALARKKIVVPSVKVPSASQQSVGKTGGAFVRTTTPTRSLRRPILEGVFGPYEIEGEIARGGVGAVFRAKEVDGGRHVALKVLLDGDEAGELERERFHRECETAKALALPGMVQIYALGEVEGKPYMAMELIEGRSLDKLIPERSLSVNDCLVLMQAVAETVGALHEAGYVHRDLKPANILLGPYGTPKVADFGLVKSLDEVTRLTASGLVCGTPAYMAPEQARGDGKNINPQSDVWALGAVLYEMLTGTPPFQADNALRLMLKITKDAPQPLRHLNPKVPREAEAIVLKCLEKHQERRYAGAKALAADLKRFLEGQPIEARAPGSWSRVMATVQANRKLAKLLAAGLAAVVVVAILAHWVLAPQDAEAHAARGRKLLRDQRVKEAEEAFRMAVRLDPKHAQAHLGLGFTVGAQAVDRKGRRVTSPERFEEALAITNKARELDLRLSAPCFAQIAELHYCAADYQKQIWALEQAIPLQINNPVYRYNLAMAYWNLGAQSDQRMYFEKALQEFNTVLKLKPDYPQVAEFVRRLQERHLPAGTTNSSTARLHSGN